ncbi:hypothetical protein [Flavobacterium johnsoniae]|uniref:hypothetical protein n=1 Tax=Flavobacterium johnsoniae TaxID=986 RepID=UPI0011EDD1D1|nr:hypothetical protein [Flavobacterium johnsoniae]
MFISKSELERQYPEILDIKKEFIEKENSEFLILENREFKNHKQMIFDTGLGIPWDKDICNPYPKLKLSKMQITNCVFSKCKVISSFAIRAGVSVKNVVFDNVKCSDILTISTGALLDNLIIKGKEGLWIKPDSYTKTEVARIEYNKHILNWISTEQQKIDCMLNIMELDSDDVEILGIPIDKILFDPERYLPIYREWNDLVDLKSSRISSLLKICIQRLKTFDVPYGLISIPSKISKKYFEEIESINYLKEIGVIK